MQNIAIGVFWTEGPEGDPLVAVKIVGSEGTEELKKVIVSLENSLRSTFPDVWVILQPSAKKIFEEGVGTGS